MAETSQEPLPETDQEPRQETDQEPRPETDPAPRPETRQPRSDLHPCLVVYGECSFGPNCLYMEMPRNACIYYLKGKCTNPKASKCNNGVHYPEHAEKMKEAQAALYASGQTPRIPKKSLAPSQLPRLEGWRVVLHALWDRPNDA